MDTDRNLLFGVLALQADLITNDQFAEACSAWAARKSDPLAELLVERGWLGSSDRADVERLLERKLKKHGGDVRASLMEATTNHVRQSLAGVDDPEVARSLTPPIEGHVLLATTEYMPEARDRYTLSRLHATGGIGRVWLARDASLGRDVALKELRPERSGQTALWGRFLKEAQITGQLEHPGIVPVYELGKRGGAKQPFYTMRFVRGRTLAEAVLVHEQRLKAGTAGPLELRELLNALVGVCNAVAYAHSRGVIHRDLKPQNVVLGDFGEVIVLDWGLAKVINQSDDEAVTQQVDFKDEEPGTIQGQILGTPAYLAPEQAEGRLDLLDTRTDVYGLGAILYQILTGQPPFNDSDTTSLLRRVIHEAPTPPRSIAPTASPALEAVCLKALSKSPAERYAGAKDLAAEVLHWLADEPISARPDPAAVRVRRWARKHRTLVASAATMVLMALAASSVGLVTVSGFNRRLEVANADLKQSNDSLVVARADADDKRREAEKERNVATAVNAFLQTDLLGQADISKQPFQGVNAERNPNITVAELLERAAKSLEGKFANQEETESAIRLTIGDAFRALGNLKLAQPHLERSLALRVQHFGEDHPHTLESRNRLALLYFAQGKFGQAEPLCLEVVRLREKELGVGHPETLISKHNLNQLYLAQGKYGQAEPLILEILREIEKNQGPEHPDTLGSKHALALLYLNQKRFEKAEPLCLEVSRLREKVQGADHPDTLTGKHNLAGLYQAQGKYDKAEPLCLEVLRLREKRLGLDHPHTLASKNMLALVYVNQGKYDKCEPLYLEVLQLREKKLGAEHPETLVTKNNLAWMYYSQKKYDKAEPLYLEVLRLREKALGALHPNTLNTTYNLSLSYRARGELEKAQPLAEQAVTGGIKSVGFGHPTTQASIRDLAILYERLKTPEKAQPILQQQLDFLKGKTGADSLDTAGAMVELGANLVRLKKYSEAEPMLLDGYAGLQKHAGRLPSQSFAIRNKEVLERLVTMYEATGNNGEAAKWRQRLDALAKVDVKAAPKN